MTPTRLAAATRPPPPEWAPHTAIWTAWPFDAEEWPRGLEPVRAELAALVRALSEPGPDGRPGDNVKVLARAGEPFDTARAALGDCAEIVEAAYGDIWLRDTGPIFLSQRSCRTFRINGWGGKYVMEGDDEVAAFIADRTGSDTVAWDMVLEGGGVDWDGEGTVLTTRQCLLNGNRNENMTEAEAEHFLLHALGARKVIWLEEGMLNDHTDGHVDNIARFVAPGRVACQMAAGPDDPNAAVFDAIAQTLAAATDAKGRKLDVVRIPSPGRYLNEEGVISPASHMNFLIGNATVAVPTYGTPSAPAALEALAALFPGRRVVGLPAHAILGGGGAFHCITQQQPEAEV